MTDTQKTEHSAGLELLEQSWDVVAGFFAGLSSGIERGITSLFGSSNARFVRKLQPKVEAIGALEPKYQAMNDEQLRAQTVEFRGRLAAGESFDDILFEAFAVCREAGRRYLGMRHFDVQLIGGMVLHGGAIAEMVTGEGKTLVATLPAYLNALEGKGVHVVTVNDYLARRDMEWMGPLYLGLGLTVGAIQSNMDSAERQKAYACDITYGTNNEFGFDYLRDNMRPAARGDNHYPKPLQQAQGPLHFAIIDEVDNILVDEARTPLIISGPAHDDVTKYAKADRLARQLKKDEHFEVKEKEHTVNLTDEGVRAAEKLAGVESFYTAGNMEWPHLIDNALKAHHLYKLDVNYVVQEGEVIIVDEFTGRLMHGRNWSDGLHQAVEAKEGVKIKEESQTLATITLQNFFKLYDKICGMTGTAMTEAAEFWKIYKLDVIAIPTNKDMRRINHPDVIYRSETEKFTAIADEIEHINKWDMIELADGTQFAGTITKETPDAIDFQSSDRRTKETYPREKIREIQHKGRPVLVGTVSIEKSERLASLLERRGIPHEVLNAKHHKREAEIVSQAGRKGGVTIATNMAGRGTDIVLGGNPETMAWAMLQDKYPTRLDVPPAEWEALVREVEQREQMKDNGQQVKEMGGLHIIGTERHESRRIDLQLRGRCGRQGDPGSSRFYLSLEDDLMRIFAGEWVKNILTRLGMKEGEAIESRMVSRRIEGAQKKVEERNFDIRKNLLEYDEVMDEQRKRVYGYRQKILDGANCKQLILEMIDGQIDHYLKIFLDPHYGQETFATWAGGLFTCEIDSKPLAGLDFTAADRYVRDEAERAAESQIFEAVEEKLPEGEEETEWNWEDLAKFSNLRWKTNFRDRDLKKIGRDEVVPFLIERSREAIAKVDLSEGARFLADGFGVQTACAWVQHKFGIKLDPADMRKVELQAFKDMVHSRGVAAYEEKEIEYPVLAGMAHFMSHESSGQKRLDRDGLAAWARKRFQVELDNDELRDKQRDEVRAMLIDKSRAYQAKFVEVLGELNRRVEQLPAEPVSATALAITDKHAGGPHANGHAANGHAAEDQHPGDPFVAANGALGSVLDWLHTTLERPAPSPAEFARLRREELKNRLAVVVEDRFRPEMRVLERSLVLQILDTAWKDHLLAMDHLRSAVSLRGWAQIDPKVEYKREGMRTFEQMWTSVGERVTDLIFKIEQLDQEFVGSTWKESRAVHEEAPGTQDIARQQQSAIDASETQAKIEPIRNQGPRPGRNEPCPCGSGKKYKNCHMRSDQQGGARRTA
ncbi:MAG TPA: SEC-C metal-binding domain-containing protein [Pirellulales bacterium]|nr:SEC-C metal-binding domain-containing protein [Pirellulales bacterium]